MSGIRTAIAARTSGSSCTTIPTSIPHGATGEIEWSSSAGVSRAARASGSRSGRVANRERPWSAGCRQRIGTTNREPTQQVAGRSRAAARLLPKPADRRTVGTRLRATAALECARPRTGKGRGSRMRPTGPGPLPTRVERGPPRMFVELGPPRIPVELGPLRPPRRGDRCWRGDRGPVLSPRPGHGRCPRASAPPHRAVR